ncbi:MAG: hypothetical protein HEQ23_04510 [Tepidisphaera sp.]
MDIESGPPLQQLSEVYRQGVCIPLDDSTEAMFRTWWTSSTANARVLPLGDAGFLHLWQSGALPAINAACGLRIDEHEEVVLEAHQAEGAIRAAEAVMRGRCEGPKLELWKQLRSLLAEAHASNRPVFFVL